MGSGELTLKLDFLEEKWTDWMDSSQGLFQLEEDSIYEVTGTNTIYLKLNSGKCACWASVHPCALFHAHPLFSLAEVP